MERGLLWLPLLLFFFWLTWSGWREYQKIEAYQRWAEEFEQAKYDIYAVLGKKDLNLTWGKPTQKQPIELQTFSLKDVRSLKLLVNNQPVDLSDLPRKGKPCLEFVLNQQASPIKIPFTDITLAAKWQTYLEQQWQQSTSDNTTHQK